MSTEVENRVLDMKFNNAAFEKGAATTLGTLEKLKAKLNFTGAANGLKGLQTAGNKFNLNNVSNNLSAMNKNMNSLQTTGSRFDLKNMVGSVAQVTKGFSVMNIAGVTAIATIVNKAVNAGIQLVKSFTIAPLSAVFSQYQQQINATQTILANTAASGATLGSVTKTLEKMNVYANKTIYNFSDMATNLGTFTSAGIKLGPASEAIEGLSNVAAAAGASTQQAAGAMYQISQALGRGKVTAQDWNSVVSAGMASSNFKNAILETAKAMGTLKMPKTQTIEQWTKAGGNFQEAMSKGQITSQVLITTLQAMTGNMTDAQLAAKGYNKQQIKSLQAMADQAAAAAKNVKTVTALVDNLQQGVGSAYAEVFKTIMGDLPTATKNLTKLSEVLTHIFVDPINKLNTFIKGFIALKGREEVIYILHNLFLALGNVLKPIGKAFREVFPPASAKKFRDLAVTLKFMTSHLIANKEEMNNIQKVFRGIFTVLKFGLGIIGAVIKVVFTLIRSFSSLVPGIIALAGALGQFIFKLNGVSHGGDIMKKFFDILNGANSKVLVPFLKFISKIAEALAALLQGDVSGFQTRITSAFGSVGKFVNSLRDKIVNLLDKLAHGGNVVGEFLANFGSSALTSSSGFVRAIGSIAATVGQFIGEFTSGAAEKVVAAVTKISEATANMFTSFSFKKPDLKFASFADEAEAGATSGTRSLNKLKVVGEAVGSIITSILKALSAVASVIAPAVKGLSGIFTTILDKIKEYIAGMDFQDALALLNTGFLIALYKSIQSVVGKFNATLGALENLFDSAAGTLDQLTASLKTMQNSVRVKMVRNIAIAVALLAAAVYVLAKIDPKKLAIAIGALTALFVQVIAALAVITKFNLLGPKGLTQTGAALILIATAMVIMTQAVRILGKMDVDELKQGLWAIGLVLLALGAAAKIMSGAVGILATAAGLYIISAALLMFAGVIVLYSKIDWGTFGHGITIAAGSLLILGLAMNAFPPHMIATSLGLVAMAFALTILAKALKTMGRMSKGEIAKSLITLAGALTILVVAVLALNAGQQGVVVLLALAVALRILVPALKALGEMSLWEIVKALIALAGFFLIIGGAAIVLTPVIPLIAALAVALGLLGIALLGVGLGTFLFAKALELMVHIGIAAITAFLQALPLFVQQLGNIFLAAIKVIGDATPKFVAALVKIVLAVIDGLNKIIPKVIDLIGNFIIKLADKAVEMAPHLVDAGFKIVLAFLRGLDEHIDEITTRGTNIILKFMKAIQDQAGPLADQAFETIIDFINAISNAIDEHAGDLQRAGGRLAASVLNGFTFGLSGKAGGLVKDALGGLGIGDGNKDVKPLEPIAPRTSKTTTKATEVPVKPVAPSGSTTQFGNSLRRMVQSLAQDIEVAPTITPVVDLSQFRKDSLEMARIVAASDMSPVVSYQQAAAIADETEAAKENATDAQTVNQVSLVQNNYSPEALSTGDIYRKTNNQLSLAKSALAPTTKAS